MPDFEFPSPPTTGRGAATTTRPNLSSVALESISGRTTTIPPVVGPGRSRIEGVVTGPTGPVGGAIVRIERFVGDAAASADVVTRVDGTFTTDPILGGRYRVRAWRAPDLTIDKPVVFYLEDGKVQPVNFTLVARQGVVVNASIAPSPPIEDEPANLVVAVSTREVDSDGVVRSRPVADAVVDLFAPPDWTILSADPVVTDAAGRAGWRVACARRGSTGLFVAIGGASYELAVPACGQLPTTTTSTTDPSGTTVTTRRDSGQAITTATTTRERGGGGGRDRDG